MPRQAAPVTPNSFKTLGELLSFLRERAHLTQRQLAAKVSYHYSYISRIEKNQHVPAVSTLMGRFVPALEIQNEPEWTERLLELVSQEQNEQENPPDGAKKTVPEIKVFRPPVSLTSMLGREEESKQLIQLLENDEVHIVTIVGPPGVGKTRLSLHMAEQVAGRFANGVIFVDLTPIPHFAMVLWALAEALEVQETAETPIEVAIESFLKSKELLIIFDNFEQVLPASPSLAGILQHASKVKMLVTSREALRASGEYEFPLTPLPLPEINDLDMDSMKDSPSIQLFIQRAGAVNQAFSLTEENASHVAEICRRLDGLPLAIELAASRTRTLSLATMLKQFERRFDWLTRGRSDTPEWRQNLRGAVEWSYNLLSEQERTLLNRLSVFSGGWTLEAAEIVCSDNILCKPVDIFSLMINLADKSLIATDGERYRFLETLREFAHEKLKESTELDIMQEQYFDYFLQLAQDAKNSFLQGGNQVSSLNQMETEKDNLRSVLTWACASPTRVDRAMQLGLSLSKFWQTRGYFTEARQWIEKILSLDTSPTSMRANLLTHASDFASIQGNYENAHIFAKEGLEIFRSLNDENGIHYSMDFLAKLSGMQGDYAHTAELLEKVLEYRRQVNDTVPLTKTLNNLAIALRRLGNNERAREIYTESIALSKKVGNLVSLAHSLNGLAEVYSNLKDYESAAHLHRESLKIRHELGDLKGIAFSFGSLAITLYQLGDSTNAVLLEGAAAKIREELGLTIPSANREEKQEFINILSTNLGRTEFERIWSEGQSMLLDQIISKIMTEK